MNVKIRNKFIEIKYSVSYGLVIFITNYRWFRILEISRYRRSTIDVENIESNRTNKVVKDSADEKTAKDSSLETKRSDFYLYVYPGDEKCDVPKESEGSLKISESDFSTISHGPEDSGIDSELNNTLDNDSVFLNVCQEDCNKEHVNTNGDTGRKKQTISDISFHSHWCLHVLCLTFASEVSAQVSHSGLFQMKRYGGL